MQITQIRNAEGIVTHQRVSGSEGELEEYQNSQVAEELAEMVNMTTDPVYGGESTGKQDEEENSQVYNDQGNEELKAMLGL